MADLGFIVINAITLACIYGTLAIGLSITWSSLGLVNMAYGFIFALAGYGAWLAAQTVSQHGAIVLAAGVLTGALGGLLVCLLAFIPIWLDSISLRRALVLKRSSDNAVRQSG